MEKRGTIKGAFWAAGAAFAVFSGAVALGWLRGMDLWALRTIREHPSGLLDGVLGAFSLLGSLEVTSAALLALLAGLLLRGYRLLAGRILVAFVATGVLELAMKLYLPQVPRPGGGELVDDFEPLFAIFLHHSYPSGHVLRSVIVFGALYLLSENRFLRAVFLAVSAVVAVSVIYLGLHWASDAVGGVLLGLAALLWAFEKRYPFGDKQS